MHACVVTCVEFATRSFRQSTTTAEPDSITSSWLVPGLPLLLCSLATIVVILVVYAVCVRGRYHRSLKYGAALQSSDAEHGSASEPTALSRACEESSDDAATHTTQLHRYAPTIRSPLPHSGYPLPCSAV